MNMNQRSEKELELPFVHVGCSISSIPNSQFSTFKDTLMHLILYGICLIFCQVGIMLSCNMSVLWLLIYYSI